MGLRFRKSFNILPGVKVNLNKKSAGVTLGTKGLHYTVNTSGKRTASVGLPGTGLSYSTTSGGKKKGGKQKETPKATFQKWLGIVIAVIAVICVIGAVKNALDKGKASDNPILNAVSSITQSNDAASDASVPQNAAISGSNAASASTDASSTVWISGSGKKYHTRPDCSGMENATQITLQEALDMGKEPCKRCG